MSNRDCWRGSLLASRVARLSLMVSMTWKGRLTRGTCLRVPSSLYFPGQTSSVLVISILAIPLLTLFPYSLCCCYFCPAGLFGQTSPSVIIEKLTHQTCRVLNASNTKICAFRSFNDVKPVHFPKLPSFFKLGV